MYCTSLWRQLSADDLNVTSLTLPTPQPDVTETAETQMKLFPFISCTESTVAMVYLLGDLYIFGCMFT